MIVGRHRIGMKRSYSDIERSGNYCIWLRCRIASLAFDILQGSSEAFLENGIDLDLWTYCFYRLYSEKRAHLKDASGESIESFLKSIDEGIEYYEYLIRVISDSMDPLKEDCLYPLFIHLGDIYRYKAGLVDKNEKSVWEKCEWCYKEAILLNPNNGNAFHQLAIVATYRYSSLPEP